MRLDLYEFAHLLKDKLPFLWTIAEKINEWLFLLRYGKRLPKAIHSIKSTHSRYSHKYATSDDIDALVMFFQKQPTGSFRFFKPHAFDGASIKRLIQNRSFLAFVIFDGTTVVGYYFLRSFFIGKAYLGKIVDADYQGKGIGKEMCLTAMDLASKLKLRMYETISKDNLSSLYSTQKVLDVKIIRELPDNYLYIEDFPKEIL